MITKIVDADQSMGSSIPIAEDALLADIENVDERHLSSSLLVDEDCCRNFGADFGDA